MEKSALSENAQSDMIRRCLGLQSVDRPSPHCCGSAGSTASQPAAVHNGLPAGFLLEPRLICTISCKWKKDRKPCGITDVAITDDGRIFVADFLNKAVKIYDSVRVKLFQILCFA